MKILHVLTQLPAKTGSGVYFTNLIDSLNNIGVENAAIYGAEEKLLNLVNLNVKNEECILYNTEEVPFHICGMSDEMPYESTVYSEMTENEIDILLDAFKKRLVKMKEEFKPDIVISHHLFLITNLVREIFDDIPVVGICHGTDIRQILKHKKFLNRLKSINKLDKVLTVTPSEHDDIENVLGVKREKIHLVGGGYNEKVFYPPIEKNNSNTIKIMYAGKITESKGIYALAATLPYLEKIYPNVQIHIVGNSTKEEREKMLMEANYSDNLRIYNAENQMIMADHLRDSQIFVLPSYFEALGLIAIEALACHKLVVTSDIPGLKNLLKEDLCNSGIIKFTELPRLVDVDKPVTEDIHAYVERLKDNIIEQIENLNKNIFTEEINERIEDYSWKNIGKRIYDIIK